MSDHFHLIEFTKAIVEIRPTTMNKRSIISTPDHDVNTFVIATFELDLYDVTGSVAEAPPLELDVNLFSDNSVVALAWLHVVSS